MDGPLTLFDDRLQAIGFFINSSATNQIRSDQEACELNNTEWPSPCQVLGWPHDHMETPPHFLMVLRGLITALSLVLLLISFLKIYQDRDSLLQVLTLNEMRRTF